MHQKLNKNDNIYWKCNCTVKICGLKSTFQLRANKMDFQFELGHNFLQTEASPQYFANIKSNFTSNYTNTNDKSQT